jgi:rSAM/selenodomain-associated transferase 2/rSAM/selenodomain-associated transferase 1
MPPDLMGLQPVQRPAGAEPAYANGGLIIFTRYPEPGKCKTRLIPALGAEGAAHLQRDLILRTLAWARDLRGRDIGLELHYAGPEAPMRAWLGGKVMLEPQCGGDLGGRMHDSLTRMLQKGAPRAVLAGCDIPGLTSGVMARAFEALKESDLVLGPADDGGYYLVGLKKPAPGLFRDMSWGHGQVLAQTLDRARSLGLSYALLDELCDVDHPHELPAWHDAPLPPGSISVVIPTLNEAGNLPRTLDCLQGPWALEVIVVDGGSRDHTAQIARQRGLKVISGPSSRGLQLRMGCRAVRGRYILMLHADTLLRPGWHLELRRLLERPGVALGAFSFMVDVMGPGYWLIETMVALRSGLAQLPYGDQALFIKRSNLEALGGMPGLRLMEDVDLVRKARRLGRVAISRLPAVSSARRWRKKGVVRNTLLNWRSMLSYQMGASPDDLARKYYG